MSTEAREVGVGLAGFGYWGPNLARNFSAVPGCAIRAICDRDERRRDLARLRHPSAAITEHYETLLRDPQIDAVLIATPVSSHFELARLALEHGKDVLVEKPLTTSVEQAAALVQLAKQRDRILAVDHTYLFTGAVQKLKELVASGDIGQVMYIDSVRVNLGLFQHDINVIYDLAPHDLSIVNHLIDADPVAVTAMGSSHSGNGIESLAYLHLEYAGGVVAHFHVNWVAPVKIRRMLIGGTRKMIVYDDMQPSEKVLVYDRGIVLKEGDVDSLYRIIVDYRMGDMVAPKLAHREALAVEAEHFVDCVRNRTAPLCDGRSGLRVVRVLEAAQASLRDRGRRIEIGGA